MGIPQEDPGIADPTGGDLALLGGAAESSNLVVRTVVLPTDAGAGMGLQLMDLKNTTGGVAATRSGGEP